MSRVSSGDHAVVAYSCCAFVRVQLDVDAIRASPPIKCDSFMAILCLRLNAQAPPGMARPELSLDVVGNHLHKMFVVRDLLPQPSDVEGGHLAANVFAEPAVALPLRFVEELIGGGLLGECRMRCCVLQDVERCVACQRRLDH